MRNFDFENGSTEINIICHFDSEHFYMYSIFFLNLVFLLTGIKNNLELFQ